MESQHIINENYGHYVWRMRIKNAIKTQMFGGCCLILGLFIYNLSKEAGVLILTIPLSIGIFIYGLKQEKRAKAMNWHPC